MFTVYQCWSLPERRAAAVFSEALSSSYMQTYAESGAESGQDDNYSALDFWVRPSVTKDMPDVDGVVDGVMGAISHGQKLLVRSGHYKLRKLDEQVRNLHGGDSGAFLDPSLGGAWFAQGAVAYDFSDLASSFMTTLMEADEADDNADLTEPNSWIHALHWVLRDSSGIELVVLRPGAGEGISGVFYAWKADPTGLHLTMYWESHVLAHSKRCAYLTTQSVHYDALTGAIRWGGLGFRRSETGQIIEATLFMPEHTWVDFRDTIAIEADRVGMDKALTGRSAGGHYELITCLHLSTFFALKNRAVIWSERKPAKRRKKGSRRRTKYSTTMRTCRIDKVKMATVERKYTGDKPPRKPCENPGANGPYTGPTYHVKKYERPMWVLEANVRKGEEWLDLKTRPKGGYYVRVNRECNKKGYTVGDAAQINLTRAVPANPE